MKKVKDALLGFFVKIYVLKFHILAFFVFFIIFLRIYFPQEQVINIILNTINKKTGITFEPQEPSLNFIPKLGINFNEAFIKFPSMSSKIILGKTSIGIPLVSFISLSPEVDIKTESFQGNIEGTIDGIPLNPMRSLDEVFLDIETKNVQIASLTKVFLPIEIFATVDALISGNFNLMNPSYSNIKIDLEMGNIGLMEGNIVGFPIPAVKLKKGIFSAVYTKNEMAISKLILGSSSEDIDLYIRGNIKFKFYNPYEFVVQLKLNGQLEKQYGSFLSMGGLAQAKRADGYYAFVVKGNSETPIPTIEPQK